MKPKSNFRVPSPKSRPGPVRPPAGREPAGPPRTGVARALSKCGFCSRSEGWKLVQAGQVSVNGVVRLDPEWRVVLGRDHLEVAGQPVQAEAKVYLMLHKPRGLVTTAHDEKGRGTVFNCLQEGGARGDSTISTNRAALSSPSPSGKQGERAGEKGRASRAEGAQAEERGFHGGHAPKPPALPVPHLFPVGRLDQASEGLLLFTNDAAWADRITDPASHLDKTYHVQVGCVADEPLLARIRQGVQVEQDHLAVKRVSLLRHGERNSWLEIVLDEGKNRHIRRLLSALEVNVLRLIRIAVGPLVLGNLPKGRSRPLTPAEVGSLAKLEAGRVPRPQRA